MGRSFVRGMVSCVLMCVLPASMFAADTNAAMLYTNGTAWVNGTHVPRFSSAIFSGDLLQTRSDSVANITLTGSSITVLADSLVQFEGSSLNIEHGGLTVSTSKGVATTAGEVKVQPASSSWTEFNVTDVDGTVRIAARKGDLLISDDSGGSFTLPQGQETTRQDSPDQVNNGDSDKNQSKKKKNKKRAAGAAPAAGGGLLNSPIVVGAGAAAIVGVTTWVLIKTDNPASPSIP
jgi:hypothetical protein